MKTIILLMILVSCGKDPVKKVDVQAPSSSLVEQEPVYPRYKDTALNINCDMRYDKALEGCMAFPVGSTRAQCVSFVKDDLYNGCPERICREQCSTLTLTDVQKFKCLAYCVNN